MDNFSVRERPRTIVVLPRDSLGQFIFLDSGFSLLSERTILVSMFLVTDCA